MKRKLVKLGDITLMVSLPSKWVKQHSLKQGDEIDVTPKDNVLVLSGKGTAETKSTTIHVTAENLPNLRTAIASAYKSGYDEIILQYTTPLALEKLNTLVSSFTGLEVVSQDKQQCIIKSFLSKETNETEQLIIKMFQITKLVAETVWNDWEKTDLKNMVSLVKTNMMKLRDHCLRMIHLNNHGGDKSYEYYDLVTTLELICTEFYYFAQQIVKEHVAKEVYVKDVVNYVNEIYQAYLSKKIIQSHAVRNDIGKFIAKEIVTSNKIIQRKDPTSLFYSYHICRLYRHLCSRLLGLSN